MQAVHELYDVMEGPEWAEEEVKMTRVVVIGLGLDQSQLMLSLQQAISEAMFDSL